MSGRIAVIAAPGRRDRASDRVFRGAFALLFVASAGVTIAWTASMSEMGGMTMPGGWTMSMAWMPMGEQTWLDAAATFLGMWAVMMTAMMLPSLMPMLLRYRERHRGAPVATAAAAYFLVWLLFGIAIFPLGAALAALEHRIPAVSRAVPFAGGAVVLLAGALQFTAWKARRLACCRETACDAASSLRHGLRLGFDCVLCCAPQTAILLALGVMDLGAMAVVTAAITAERLAPEGERMARLSGALAVVAGAILIARAVALA